MPVPNKPAKHGDSDTKRFCHAYSLAIVRLILLIVVRFHSLIDVSNESIRPHLRLLGSSIDEYHDKTGYWLSQAEDLAQTSLPSRSPYWKVMLDSGTNIIVWHKDLKPNPAENADVVLAYHNRGLLASFGRQWIC